MAARSLRHAFVVTVAAVSCSSEVLVLERAEEAGAGGAATGGGPMVSSARATGPGAGGGETGCLVGECWGRVYECGDCVDNDADGLTDMADPACTGVCDNSEEDFGLGIPCNPPPCLQDCFYDGDCGAGNDDCRWSHQCDALEPWGAMCSYDPNAFIPGSLGGCSELEQSQSQACLGYCEPITPNGCDCFGCCELPAGSAYYVWLGSLNESTWEPCTLETIGDPSSCRPCTPVVGCFNPCEVCEICIGETTLEPGCGIQACPADAQPCGLPGQTSCPDGSYCLTGCCAKAPQ